jgi:hypothetical protein
MVVSLMVAFVVMLLATVIFGQAIHNSDQSALGRRRLTSVVAAEAGLDYWYNYLQRTATTSLSTSAVTRNLGSSPATSSFTATPTFYSNRSGTTPFSGAITSSSFPLSVKIKSVGTVNGTTRTMESFLALRPIYGGFRAAMMTNNGTNFGSNFDVYGLDGNDGDVYILQGDLDISNTPNIRGNVYVPNGGVTMSNNNKIWGDLYSRDTASVTNVGGSVYSETGNIVGGTIDGDAKAAGTISGNIGGTQSPNSTMSPTPTQAFPQVKVSSITTSDYTNVNSFSTCSAALTWIKSTWSSGNAYVRITGATPCTMTTGNTNIELKGGLTVVSDWGYDLSKTGWTSTSTYPLALISAYPESGTLTCPASGTSSKNITMDNQTDYATTVQTFIYSPCTVDIANKTQMTGQVLGGNLTINNHFTMTYTPVVVPGVTGITGFEQDIAYIREVI